MSSSSSVPSGRASVSARATSPVTVIGAPSTSSPRGGSSSISVAAPQSDQPDAPTLSALARERTVSNVKRFVPEDWENDGDVSYCKNCNKRFTLINRKHHCRNCGSIYCADCTKTKAVIKEKNYHTPVRVCGRCAYSLAKTQKTGPPNPQLKSQLSAMEEVSAALLLENQQLRALIENLEKTKIEQNLIIQAYRASDSMMRSQLAKAATPTTAAAPTSDVPTVAPSLSPLSSSSSAPPASVSDTSATVSVAVDL